MAKFLTMFLAPLLFYFPFLTFCVNPTFSFHFNLRLSFSCLYLSLSLFSAHTPFSLFPESSYLLCVRAYNLSIGAFANSYFDQSEIYKIIKFTENIYLNPENEGELIQIVRNQKPTFIPERFKVLFLN